MFEQISNSKKSSLAELQELQDLFEKEVNDFILKEELLTKEHFFRLKAFFR
jgi:hypothetical protein